MVRYALPGFLNTYSHMSEMFYVWIWLIDIAASNVLKQVSFQDFYNAICSLHHGDVFTVIKLSVSNTLKNLIQNTNLPMVIKVMMIKK